MEQENIPTGELFSRVYNQRGQPTQDSAVARRRIASFIDNDSNYESDLATLISIELGEKVPYNGYYQWERFFTNASVQVFLDVITLAYRVGYYSTSRNGATKYIEFASRVFREENIGYSVDNAGGVRFFIDNEFEKNRFSTLSGLDGKLFETARKAFEDAHAALSQAPPDTLSAVRRSFDAVENAFKIAFPQESRLGSAEINKRLKPKMADLFDERAANSAKLFLEGMGDWVNSCHQYRHEHGQSQHSPPPLILAIALVSTGSTYLRFLIELQPQILVSPTIG